MVGGVDSVEVRTATSNDVFLYYTGRKLPSIPHVLLQRSPLPSQEPPILPADPHDARPSYVRCRPPSWPTLGILTTTYRAQLVRPGGVCRRND